MRVITEAPRPVPPALLAGRTRDTLSLTWEERRWTRKRVTTAAGREVALALATGTVLDPGAILLVADDWYLVVEARPEPLLAIFPASREEALRLAFEVGNRHFTLGFEDGALLVPDDAAMRQLATRAGARWEPREAVYTPLGGGPDD
ncbi:MAG TPA: urease accessory protein UreE [Methylomirabilota bacterium]|jgi:urease accessory protein